MPLYDYKCDCGCTITIQEPFEKKSYFRTFHCPECRKFKEFRWQPILDIEQRENI